MIYKYQKFTEIKSSKADYKFYGLPKMKEVPESVKSYSDMLSNFIIDKFDKWFYTKSKKSLKKQIIFDWDEIRSNISDDDFLDLPIETLELNLEFNFTSDELGLPDPNDYLEGGVFRQIARNDIGTDLMSYEQESENGLTDESYYAKFFIDINIPKKIKSIDVDRFEQRIKSLVYHEMAHAHENIGIGQISTARAHVQDAPNIKALAIASPTIEKFVYLTYFSSPEEIYAHSIGSYPFRTFDQFKSHWVYKNLQDLKEFNAQEFINSLTEELPEKANWESHDLIEGEIVKYSLPKDLPKLFVDYHNQMLEIITNYGTVRQDYHHIRYSDMREWDLKQFAEYWEEEFHSAAKILENNIRNMFNEVNSDEEE